MSVAIHFDRYNAAFDHDPNKETASILRRLSETIACTPPHRANERSEIVIRDSKGNAVGTCVIDPAI